MAFAIAHPGVPSAIMGPRTLKPPDDPLTSVDVTLTTRSSTGPPALEAPPPIHGRTRSATVRLALALYPFAGEKSQPAP